MAAGNEKQDDLEKLFGRPESGSASKPPGDFTRAFFGLEIAKRQHSVEAPASDSAMEPATSASYPQPASTPGEFTRTFGTLNPDAPAREAGATEERAHPGLQNGIPSSDPGTLTDLFAQRNQVSLKPLNPQSDTFSRFFSSDALTVEPTQSSPFDFTQVSKNAGSVPSLGADASTHVLPGIDAQDEEKRKGELATGSPAFGDSTRGTDQQKATRLFSLQKSTADRGIPSGGPSAFTRVIDSSALRAAEEKPDSIAPFGNNPPQQPPPAASAVAPAIAPQWPVASVPVPPIHPSAYLPQQPMPMQMSMPPVASWPQVPSVPAVTPPPVQQPQIQSAEHAQQATWITYLPLIIGLNVLFLLAVVLILFFALSR